MFSCLFFFKQKTAYEMRISDWSSDVCSSDLPEKMARLIIQEMEDTLVEVRSMAVGFLARKKELQRAIDTLGNEALDWEAKAELAVSKDRDDLARGALSAQRRATERIADARREVKLVADDGGQLEDENGKQRAT